MKKIITTALGLFNMIALAQGNPNDYTGRVGINTATPEVSLHIKKHDGVGDKVQGVLFPEFDNTPTFSGTIPEGTMIYNKSKHCLEIYAGNPLEWSCVTTVATSSTGGGGNNSGGTSFTSTGTQAPITGNVTLLGTNHYIASIKDTEYIPFTKPTTPATWDTGETNGNDPEINVPGIITTQGIDIQIPIAVTGNGTVGAYHHEIVVAPEKSANNTSGVLILEWTNQTVNSNSTFITAKLKAKNTNFHIKQLDINKGLGNDYEGVELGTFSYKKDSSHNATETFTIRVLGGIPDIRYKTVDTNGRRDFDLIYLPITLPNGQIWLNNNLGADYANIHHPYFNPTLQAGALDSNGVPISNPTNSQISNDKNAIGYLYKRRKSTPGFSGNYQNLVPVTWQNASTHTRKSANISTYNPCPIGYNLPNRNEARKLENGNGTQLKLSGLFDIGRTTGGWISNNILESVFSVWIGSTTCHNDSCNSKTESSTGANAEGYVSGRHDNYPVRCIKQ